MESEVMVHKANQIALFFASYPRDEAVALVADHLKKFWEARMLRQMNEYLSAGGEGLHDLVPDAMRQLETQAAH